MNDFALLHRGEGRENHNRPFFLVFLSAPRLCAKRFGLKVVVATSRAGALRDFVLKMM
jgi:hypothetical protein